MKAFLSTIIFLFLSVFSYGEYQVYSFSMSLKRPEAKLVYSSEMKKYQKAYGLVNEKITGYLVTVCCYPCGADFGKCYPSWLYVKKSRDNTDSLWKVQCKVSGGVFGDKISPEYMEGNDTTCHPEFNEVTVYEKSDYMNYVKKTNRAWATIEFDGDEDFTSDIPVIINNGKYIYCFKEGFCGLDTDSFTLLCSGFGNASWKINDKASSKYDKFNIYIKNISGYAIGNFNNEDGFGYDPSNYYIKFNTQINGTFKMIYNNKLTEEIRGTADWDTIDARIYMHMLFEDIITEDLNEDLMY